MTKDQSKMTMTDRFKNSWVFILVTSFAVTTLYSLVARPALAKDFATNEEVRNLKVQIEEVKKETSQSIDKKFDKLEVKIEINQRETNDKIDKTAAKIDELIKYLLNTKA